MANWTAGQLAAMQQQQWINVTNTASTVSYIGAGGFGGYTASPPPPKAPESAVEWLNRRVNEMRVSL